MGITITIPDNIAKAAEAEAKANGSTVEQYLVATLTQRFGRAAYHENKAKASDRNSSPLLRLIGIAKNGPTDSSATHDYRPGDPV